MRRVHSWQTFKTSIPNSIRIVEVGPRDGLQNEKKVIPLKVKLEFIEKLEAAGLKNIEAGSFVSPKWIPQMANSDEIFRFLSDRPSNSSTTFSALTPNLQGLDSALNAGVNEIAVFGAASESFSQKNINCSIADSLKRFEVVCNKAIQNKVKVRGYVSCVLGCPYEGSVDPQKVVNVAKQLIDMGCYEISLGDTIGVGNPASTAKLLDAILKEIPVERIAVHFHDTYGQALPNILCSLQYGVSVIDSSVSGLGGCPYAGEGASGNVATEDVVYMLNGMGIRTGVDLERLTDASRFIDAALSRTSRSKVTSACKNK